MPRGNRRTKRPAEGTSAFHLKDGTTHVVGARQLRVVVTNEEGSWFARGLEIDYFAQGSSREDVKRRFEEGLCATIDEYLKKHGSIEGSSSPLQTASGTSSYAASRRRSGSLRSPSIVTTSASSTTSWMTRRR